MGLLRMKEGSESNIPSFEQGGMGQPAAAKSSQGGCSHGARAISVLDARYGGGSGAGGGRHGEPAEQARWSSERAECSRHYRTRTWMADGGVVRVADPAGDAIGGS